MTTDIAIAFCALAIGWIIGYAIGSMDKEIQMLREQMGSEDESEGAE